MIFSCKTLRRAVIAAGISVVALTGSASAHVWNIGWKSNAGDLVFYATSWHSSLETSTWDDFANNGAGLTINGTQVLFDLNSVVDLPSNCNGMGGLTSGSCSSDWNNLNLDGAIQSTQTPSGSTYGKYALLSLDGGELAALNILAGQTNSVTLTSWANNATWAARTFASGQIPLNIVVKPPSAVPLPAGLPMLSAGLGLLGFAGWRKRRKAA